jgi:hypothetical protein
MPIPQIWKAVVDIVLAKVNHAAYRNNLDKNGLEGSLLNIVSFVPN